MGTRSCARLDARDRARLRQENSEDAPRKLAMDRVNPKYVLRNYLAQTAIDKAQRRARQGYAGSDLIGAGPTFGSDLLKNFQGAAGVVRFHDGAVEAEFASKRLEVMQERSK